MNPVAEREEGFYKLEGSMIYQEIPQKKLTSFIRTHRV